MSFSFWANFGICVASLLSTLLNHTELLAEIREEVDPKKKSKKKWGLGLLWVVTVLSVAALPFTAWESVTSDRRMDGLEKSHSVATNEIGKLLLTVSAQSNTLAATSQKAELLDSKTKDREISPGQVEELKSILATTPKGVIRLDWISGDLETGRYKEKLSDTLTKLGYAVKDRLIFISPPSPFVGVSIGIIEPNKIPEETVAIAEALAKVGIANRPAHIVKDTTNTVIRIGIKPK